MVVIMCIHAHVEALGISASFPYTVDPKKTSVAFLKANGVGEHHFKDIQVVRFGEGECACHGIRCKLSDVDGDDIFVCGFPCQPFTLHNSNHSNEGGVEGHPLFQVCLDVIAHL